MTDRSQALGAASMYHLLRERRLRERAAAQPQRGGQRRTIAGRPRASGGAATAASGEAPLAGLPAATMKGSASDCWSVYMRDNFWFSWNI